LDHYNNFFELELGAAAPAELTVTAEIAQILVRISTRAVALTFKLQWRWSVCNTALRAAAENVRVVSGAGHGPRSRLLAGLGSDGRIPLARLRPERTCRD